LDSPGNPGSRAQTAPTLIRESKEPMFDLEEKIAEWRRQMLVAGIKTPAPLDELEGHLREEIELQINQDERSGSVQERRSTDRSSKGAQL